jgi:hypothetical protein
VAIFLPRFKGSQTSGIRNEAIADIYIYIYIYINSSQSEAAQTSDFIAERASVFTRNWECAKAKAQKIRMRFQDHKTDDEQQSLIRPKKKCKRPQKHMDKNQAPRSQRTD